MTSSAIAAIAYGLLALVGGFIGYVQAASRMSLISGVISGILLGIGGLAQFQGSAWGKPLAIAVTLILIAVFIGRLVKTRKWMPAGLMVAAGVVALLVMVFG